MAREIRIGKHPVFVFLRDELKMNLSEFSVLTGIPQSTVSTWIERKRSIETLPMYFFVSLSNWGQGNNGTENYGIKTNLHSKFD